MTSQNRIAIRPYDRSDEPALWRLLEPAFRPGDTYTVDADIPREEAVAFWTAPEITVFMTATNGVQGTYYVKPNQGGGGRHVCNAGFIVHPEARGQGIAGAMLAHAQDTARAMGFRAMQFNFVVSTNTGAIRIWEKDGFDVVGRLPEAFNHPEHGYVDALVMFKSLKVT
jgi:ribosomal protein S18 acetylase RimI-like enzyme